MSKATKSRMESKSKANAKVLQHFKVDVKGLRLFKVDVKGLRLSMPSRGCDRNFIMHNSKNRFESL